MAASAQTCRLLCQRIHLRMEHPSRFESAEEEEEAESPMPFEWSEEEEGDLVTEEVEEMVEVKEEKPAMKENVEVNMEEKEEEPAEDNAIEEEDLGWGIQDILKTLHAMIDDILARREEDPTPPWKRRKLRNGGG